MNHRIRDPVGTGVALLVGVLFGVTLAAPMLSAELPLRGVAAGPIETTIFWGLAVLAAVPATLLCIYLLFLEP